MGSIDDFGIGQALLKKMGFLSLLRLQSSTASYQKSKNLSLKLKVRWLVCRFS
jgi:hypothetical protein